LSVFGIDSERTFSKSSRQSTLALNFADPQDAVNNLSLRSPWSWATLLRCSTGLAANRRPTKTNERALAFRSGGSVSMNSSPQSPRGSRDLHGTRRPDAVQDSECCIGQIRSRPGDATEDNKAFLVGNGAYRIDHRSRGRRLQQLQQARSGLGATHPAERTGRFPRDCAISVIEQLRQQSNGRRRPACTAATTGADLWRLMPKQ
jgi:hypothetical protein